MRIKFKNGFEINASCINEDKRIYSDPQKWESSQLDELLIEENICDLIKYDEEETEKHIIGYNHVERVSKIITDQENILIIVLQKDLLEQEEIQNEV